MIKPRFVCRAIGCAALLAVVGIMAESNSSEAVITLNKAELKGHHPQVAQVAFQPDEVSVVRARDLAEQLANSKRRIARSNVMAQLAQYTVKGKPYKLNYVLSQSSIGAVMLKHDRQSFEAHPMGEVDIFYGSGALTTATTDSRRRRMLLLSGDQVVIPSDMRHLYTGTGADIWLSRVFSPTYLQLETPADASAKKSVDRLTAVDIQTRLLSSDANKDVVVAPMQLLKTDQGEMALNRFVFFNSSKPKMLEVDAGRTVGLMAENSAVTLKDQKTGKTVLLTPGDFAVIPQETAVEIRANPSTIDSLFPRMVELDGPTSTVNWPTRQTS